MAFPVYLPMLLGMVLAVTAPRAARSLPPRTEVWCLSVAAVVGAGSWAFSLALVAFTGLGRTNFVARHGHYSVEHWREVDPVGVRSAYAAGAVLGACAALFIRAVYQEVAAQGEIRRLTRGFAGPSTIVFVDDAAPHAYAVGGRQPRIVVSRGLLRTLCVA